MSLRWRFREQEFRIYRASIVFDYTNFIREGVKRKINYFCSIFRKGEGGSPLSMKTIDFSQGNKSGQSGLTHEKKHNEKNIIANLLTPNPIVTISLPILTHHMMHAK